MPLRYVGSHRICISAPPAKLGNPTTFLPPLFCPTITALNHRGQHWTLEIGNRPEISGSRSLIRTTSFPESHKLCTLDQILLHAYLPPRVGLNILVFHSTSLPHLPRVRTQRAGMEKLADACERANLTLVSRLPPSPDHLLLFVGRSQPPGSSHIVTPNAWTIPLSLRFSYF